MNTVLAMKKGTVPHLTKAGSNEKLRPLWTMSTRPVHIYIYIYLYKMPTASSSKTPREVKKPYDRSLKSSYTSLNATQNKDLGAPATHGQKTRKGKKAWRKNIDVRDEEEALEQAREEERVTG